MHLNNIADCDITLRRRCFALLACKSSHGVVGLGFVTQMRVYCNVKGFGMESCQINLNCFAQ